MRECPTPLDFLRFRRLQTMVHLPLHRHPRLRLPSDTLSLSPIIPRRTSVTMPVSPPAALTELPLSAEFLH